MSEFAIRVQNLSKRYRIGTRLARADTLAGALTNSFIRPFQNLRRLRKLTQFENGAAENPDTIWALKDVSFNVGKGKVLGFIGSNGAGKSTLLKILSYITFPSEGRVEMQGRVSSLLEVGTGFHPELSGRDNIFLNGTILGMTRKEIDRRFDEIVEFSGVEKFIDTPVKRYSSGMRVRLAFSVAAHLEPEILLIDEVLAVGDAEFQRKCLGKMGEAAESGRTVIFVSHNMEAVNSLCEYVYWLDQGKLRLGGNPTEIIEQYLSEEVALAEKDLSSHKNRRSRRIKLMQKMRFLKNGKPTSSFETNKRFEFEVEFKSDKDSMKHSSLGFLIKDGVGSTVFATNMKQYKKSFEIKGKRNTVHVTMDEIPLTPGRYSLSLYLGNGSYDLDIIEDAINFDVMWDKDLGLAFPSESSWGPIYSPVEWVYKYDNKSE